MANTDSNIEILRDLLTPAAVISLMNQRAEEGADFQTVIKEIQASASLPAMVKAALQYNTGWYGLNEVYNAMQNSVNDQKGLQTLTGKEFFDQFIPIRNSVNKDSDFYGCFWRAYGQELNSVMSTARHDPRRVWTIQKSDSDELMAINGMRHLDRQGFFITENPAPTGCHFVIPLT